MLKMHRYAAQRDHTGERCQHAGTITDVDGKYSLSVPEQQRDARLSPLPEVYAHRKSRCRADIKPLVHDVGLWK